jgi:uncharacterized delta-60 repeat protein
MAFRMRAAILAILAALAFICLACGGRRHQPLQIQQSQPRPQTYGEALALLDDMQPPQGVKPELFAQLKDALRTALNTNNQLPSARLVSTPPSGAKNAVPDLAFVDNGDGTISLTWSYYNLADYDQDGIVGVGDIIPLAEHFGEAVSPEGVNSLLAVIDGSGNDVIDIADVTPIAVNFGIEVANYDVQASPSQAGPFTSAQKVAVNTGLDAGTQRTHFAVTIELTPQYWYRVAPLDAEDIAGEPSNILQAPIVLPFLAAPSNLTAVVVSAHEIALSWQDNSTYESGFYVERRLGEFGAWSSAGNAQANSTDYSDTSVSSSSTYFYRIQAFNDLGSSAYSNEASATTPVDYSTWVHTWGGSDNESALAAAVDNRGNVYVSGVVEDVYPPTTSTADAFLLKYSSDGRLLWTKSLAADGGSGNDVIIDENGDIYVAGTIYLSSSVGFDAFLFKYSSDGEVIWQKAWGGEDWDEARSLCLDGDGNIYVAGETDGYNAFLLKCSPDGVLVWQDEWNSPVNDVVFAISADGNGDVVLAGSVYDVSSLTGPALLLKYSSTGDLLWEKTWIDRACSWFESVSIDSYGDIYAAGTSRENNQQLGGSEDAVLLKYSSDGSLIWQKKWGGEYNDRAEAISIDMDDNIYVAGFSSEMWAMFLQKLTQHGDVVWQKAWGSTQLSNIHAEMVRVDRYGFVYLTGFAANAGDTWSDASMSAGQLEGTEGVPDGVETTLNVQDYAVTVIGPNPVGIEDIGGGSEDALVMKLDPAEF